MGTQPPTIEPRSRRLVAYLGHNRDRMLADLVILAAWTIAAFWIFGVLGLPRWLLYVVLFAGAVIYTRLTPPWERPYRSPDLQE